MLRIVAGRILQKNRLIKMVFFGLFPVVFAAGIALQMRVAHRHDFGGLRLEGDRQSAIAAARAFLNSKAIDASGWQPVCAAFSDKDLYEYLQAKGKVAGSRLYRIAPPVIVKVLLQRPDGAQSAQVTLSTDNRVLGYDLRGLATKQPGPPSRDEEGSLRVAQGVVTSDPELKPLFGNSRPEVKTSEKSREYTWRAPLPDLREVELEFSVGVQNGRILSRSLKPGVDQNYVSQHAQRTTILTLFGFAYVTFLCAAALYSVYSYARRAMQKEVSHSRTALMALLVSILFAAVIASNRDDIILQAQNADSVPPFAFIAALLSLMVSGAGILVGIGYGSGEGEVREAYPGKLTSLDALVLGKVFSSNVGRSIVVGSVFAGWLLFMSALASLGNSMESSQMLNGLKFPYMVASSLSFLAIGPALVMVYAVSGLLQPIAFLNRFCRKPKLRSVLLVLFATFALSWTSTFQSSVLSFFLFTAVSVAGLLIPFYLCDLLTAIVSLVALQFFTSISNLQAPGWITFSLWMGGIALATIAAACLTWRFGRTYREEEVRPTYARHIAERQELQAEVSAAREAQLRLLPDALPLISGLSIYASCLPARVVGGDFYDFFSLSDDRLGIFIAEGGNRGLAAALSIALAKGYLMHTARLSHTPTEVLQKLEATLGSILESDATKTTVAYAVLDSRNGTLQYARTGTYPKVVVGCTGDSAPVETEVPGATGRFVLREGSVDLKPGDSIFFYTDGIARRIAARTSMLQEDWILRLANHDADARQLHATLIKAIHTAPEKQSQELEDDLTAIVIRCTQIGETFLEVVA